MLPLGLIGLGPQWPVLYRPALQRLRQRLGIRGVYTPISTHAQACCQEWECESRESLGALLACPEVRAVVLLDSNWFGTVPVEFACLHGKPVLVADSLGDQTETLHLLARMAEDSGTMVVPDLLHRHSPATTRLRELLATRLGKARSIDCEVVVGPSGRLPGFLSDPWAVALDWCHAITGTVPVRVEPAQTTGVDECLSVHFGAFADRSLPPLARVSLIRSTCHLNPDAGGTAVARARLVCERGTADLRGPDQICWQSGGTQADERLGGERSAVELLLDLFARRVRGGLIPLPELELGVRSLEWGRAAQDALSSGQLRLVERR